MKLGIKTGLRNDWKKDIETTRPDFCEIWFDASKPAAYTDLFSYLHQQSVPFGLHYWGATKDGILSNIAYPDANIIKESLQLLTDTIELAASHECIYVNFHPCGRLLTRVDFEKETFGILTKEADMTTCITNFFESVSSLARIASANGVTLTVESAPSYSSAGEWMGASGRVKTLDIGEFRTELIVDIYDIPGIYFANDLGHTAANVVSHAREKPLQYLKNIARRLKKKTRLLHVSYLIPPYNGTDYHGSLTYDEFNSPAAMPNHAETIELLKLYKDLPEICALVEPETNHIANFFALKSLVLESQK